MRVVRTLVPVLLFTALVSPPSTAGAVAPAPDAYAYLDNPRMTGEGQQSPHAELRPYADTASAALGAEQTPFTRSLDGQWKIAMADRPQDVPSGFYAEDYDVGRWRTVSVPHTWQTDGLDHPMFRNIPSEVQPDDPPHAPKDVNPTGAYARDFDLPADWQQRSTYLRFEGVTSGYFVWVNGKYVGYDQGGYTPAEFDISPALHPGRNRIAVQVHRWGSGSYLEDYDQWRYAGIFRSVWLYSAPNAAISDAAITTDLDATYTDATLNTRVSLSRKANAPAGRYSVTGSLLDARGTEVAKVDGATDLTGAAAELELSTVIKNPAKWSDESPNLYGLVLSLKGPDGRVVHVTRESVGFREITIKDKQLLVNGKRVLFKGVNRAETDPDHGRHVPRAAQERDVALMKQLNVNAVRTSHYPSDPYFYDLADRNGLWIDDEVDIETHNHESCPSVCLADRPEWRDAFLDRFTAMLARDRNHPSVFLWDTGNEAGLGASHFAMADYAKKHDPSRPLYHQSNSPDGDAPYADVWGPRYPSPEKLAEQAKSTTKPVILGEYAHAMGNSLGNFKEFWDTIRANPSLQGGFIWDWAEQNIRQRLRTTPDASGNGIMANLSGKPAVIPARAGKQGKALEFSGLDDFVEVYRDRKLDLTGRGLTLDAWVKPARPWTGDFTILSKGDHQYALKMKDEKTLEFFVHSGTWRTVHVPVPPGFFDGWHRVTGTYDGTALKLYLDGVEAGSTPFTGAIDASSYPVNVGRNSETMQDQYTGRMAHGAIDDVRIYDHALMPEKIAADPVRESLLALDFDRVDDRGSYLSYGESLSGVDGLIGSDRYLQPETAELAWAHQPLRFSFGGGTVNVLNERQFAGTDGMALRWKVTEGASTIASGTEPLRIAAGATAAIRPKVPHGKDTERFLTLEAVTTAGTPMMPAGHVVARDQFTLGGTRIPGAEAPQARGRVDVADRDGRITVSGKDFSYGFDRSTGALSSMRARGAELLKGGPKLDAWRAPTSNETYDWGRAEGEDWRKAGLDRLETTVDSVTVEPGQGEVKVVVRSKAAAPGVGTASFEQTMTYRIDAAGTVRLGHQVHPVGDVRTLPYLPRIGVSLAVPSKFERFAWYGRGPQESYVDRKDGTPVGVYSSTVDEQYVDYYRPQDHGNHTDARWALLTDGRSGGLLVSGAPEVSATPYDDLDRAAYPFQRVRNDGWTTLHADHAVTGMGDTPNPVRERYQVRPDRDYDYSLTFRPLSPDEVHSGLPRGAR